MSSSIQDIYDRIIRSQDEQQQQGRLEIAQKIAPDYDRAARVFAVEANTNLPYEIVDADLENLEEQLRRNSFDKTKYTDAVNGAPEFNKWASEHPYHIAVLERDQRELPRLERAYRQMSANWQAGWATTEIAEIRDRQLTNFDNPNNEADKKRLDQLKKYTEAAGNYAGADSMFAKLLAGAANQAPMWTWIAKESLDEALIGVGIGAAAGAGVGALPGAMVGAGIGLRRGLTVGAAEAAFRLERGLAYDEYLDMGLDEEEARWASAAVGGANAGLELLGIKAVTKYIPGFDKIVNNRVGGVINSVLDQPTMRQATARAVLRYGEGVTTELVTEIAQEATLMAAGELLKSNARERGDLRPETTAMDADEFWARVGDIAAHTMYGVGLIGGMGPAASFYKDTRQIYQAERLGVALDAMGEAAEASETRKKVPTKYDEFVQRLTKDGQTVLVDKEGFVEYFQSQGMDPEQVAASVGVTDLKEQMSDPSVGDLSIPAGQYLSKIAPSEHHKGLKQDIRGATGQLTLREAAAIKAANPAEFNKVVENIEHYESAETEQAREDILNDIKQQLVAAVTSPDAAENQKWVMVGLVTLAERMGRDPRSLYQEFFGGVIAEDQVDPTKDVDIYVDPYIDMLRAGTVPTQRDIFGPSLIDELRRTGGLAPDPELDVRDVRTQIRGLIKETGQTLDGAAELAAEQGFIASRDPNLLIDALEREMAGEDVFGNQFKINEQARELRDTLNRLEQMLDQAGIDITDMSNADVREALKNIEVFDQLDEEAIDLDTIDELTKTAVTSALHDPALQARIAAMMPELALTQEFGDIKHITPIVYKGKAGTRVSTAQREFDRTVKRKGILQKLMDCMNG